MGNSAQRRQIDRHTTFACFSLPREKICGEHEEKALAALKERGWGVLAGKDRYRFIHFDEHPETDVASILDGVDCDKTGWSVYHLRFPSVEDASALVDSAEWE